MNSFARSFPLTYLNLGLPVYVDLLAHPLLWPPQLHVGRFFDARANHHQIL